jgi:geranylgeranyl diphosphate synthase type II
MNFEEYLQQQVEAGIPSRTREAMRYALLNGGKRVRPSLLFAALKDYGVDEQVGYPAAAAIEMIHTYSLIHDDLPAMDDDTLRRGKPCTHIAFDEATAILAGDALLTAAFDQVLKSNCSAEKKVQLVSLMSKAAGADGMIYGQDLDLAFEGKPDLTMKDLIAIDTYKTACLIVLPLQAAAILAGKYEDIASMQKLGYFTGLQFQIVDDILDVTSSEEEMGKSLSDTDNEKQTAITLLGLEEAQKLAQSYNENIYTLIDNLHASGKNLKEQMDKLFQRTC